MLGAKVTGPSSPLLPLLPLKNKTGILLGVVAALIRMRDTHMCMHTHATHTHSLPLSFIPVCIPPPFSLSLLPSLHLFIHLSILLSLHPSSSLSFFFSVAVTLTPFHFLQFSTCSLLCLDYPGAMLRFPDVFPSVMEWSVWLT